MSVQLSKGQKVSLTKEVKSLSKIVVGLGWDAARGFGDSIDCDAFAILTNNGKVTGQGDLIYFGNLKHSSNSVAHMGDNLVGGGDGDDEQIVIYLDKVPTQYNQIVIGVNIFCAQSKKQHFGMIDNAHIRIVDDTNKKEICVYNLSEKQSNMTAMIFGELSKVDNEWKFNAIGQGTTDGSIQELAQKYGYKYTSSSGGCYVATAVYGSYDCPQVWTLRRFRDYTLAETWYGRIFIRTYYALSPTIVKLFGTNKWFRYFWKNKLDKMVRKLNDKGVKDTAYRDRVW